MILLRNDIAVAMILPPLAAVAVGFDLFFCGVAFGVVVGSGSGFAFVRSEERSDVAIHGLEYGVGCVWGVWACGLAGGVKVLVADMVGGWSMGVVKVKLTLMQAWLAHHKRSDIISS